MPLSSREFLIKSFGLSFFWIFCEAACRDQTTCAMCVDTTSWSGTSCRWCPRNKHCHAYASIFNPCFSAENVRNASGCDIEVPSYDPGLSSKMLLLSAAAYGEPDPQECLTKVLPISSIQIRRIVTLDCGEMGKKCLGFVGLSRDEQAIIITFRGSTDVTQLLEIIHETLASPAEPFLGGQVQSYWKKAFDKLWPGLEPELKALRVEYPQYKIWVTGYSLGGAMASLASVWIQHTGLAAGNDIVSYNFGTPRVGNYDFALQHDAVIKNSWRVVNVRDIMPHFPSILSNGPYHHGIEVHYYNGASRPDAPFKECRGVPYNEDLSCSISDFPYSIHQHLKYFGIHVGQHCRDVLKSDLSMWSPVFLDNATIYTVDRYGYHRLDT